MKYPGQPTTAPGWYKQRESSFIENEFSKEINDMADAIEQESWFGDSNNNSRYRVDFLLKDARLIVELDGHEYHSSPEQLEKDAIRQRYLTRAGYSVIRFTGREIYRNVKQCVDEVRSIHKERLQLSMGKYRVLYVDYKFVVNSTLSVLSYYKSLYPNKQLKTPSFEEILFSSIEWLHEKSFISCFIFLNGDDSKEIDYLNGLVKEFPAGEVRVNNICDELYTFELGEHLMCYSHLFDDFLIIADDPAYIHPLLNVLPGSNGKLLRRASHETTYRGTELVKYKWQDICYPIAHAYGISLHEL